MTNPVSDISSEKNYCNSLVRYSRRKTREVSIGDVPLGGCNPIRVQSMTTVDTMNTMGSVEQSIRMVEAGCEYIRITAPSLNEARNLKNIRDELHRRGYQIPLIADIHFTPNAAEEAARIVEKVRINPGNYADKKRFEHIRYTKDAYNAELERIRERFTPLVKICKEYGTAMRIGTNHGSLSDRIMSRYGDTPLGMVESALEFLRICEDLDYYEIVLSMKASNPKVMIQAYRLLVHHLDKEDLQPYPLHLGVTEAGEGEDGRIKSSVGIGTLLEDGLGDTVRVSLTEEPEKEVPVAQILIERYIERDQHRPIPEIKASPINPFSFAKRSSLEILNIGGNNIPRVISDLNHIGSWTYHDLKFIGHHYLSDLNEFKTDDTAADYIYTGQSPIPFILPERLKEIRDYEMWKDSHDKENTYPLLNSTQFLSTDDLHSELNFIQVELKDFSEILSDRMKDRSDIVIILDTDNTHGMAEQRRIFFELINKKIISPVIIRRTYPPQEIENLLLYASTDIGGLLIDGLGDGVMVSPEHVKVPDKENILLAQESINQIVFGILQATHTRITRTEYISCPSCGRTLFDLQETTAKIRNRTDHLKGVKIGIMGCIVNGPGEMADADYGYVGSGKGKITLYRGMNVVKRSVASEKAVDELIELIKEDGSWVERK
ncbi:(E)-4-hydroxy-3-methylbut-2-enyl-diphosphate synthase [Bacteroidota bacterium]